MTLNDDSSFLSVAQAGNSMGLSLSTMWRLIRRGELPSIRKGGRRLIPEKALALRGRGQAKDLPAMTLGHPIFRLAGAGRSGGSKPGARDKHAILKS